MICMPTSGKTRTAPALKKSEIEILRAENFAGLRWLMHGFSTRGGGFSRQYGRALNLGYTTEDSAPLVERNRAAFLSKLGAIAENGAGWPLVTLRQIHSDLVHVIERIPREPVTGDGLVTNVPGLLLAIQSADCLPVLLADPKRRAVGALHAGWRGTLARIVEKGKMRHAFGSEPAELMAAIGPGIHSCCYEVGNELRDKFDSQFSYSADLFHEVIESDPVKEKYPLLFLTARAPGHGEAERKLHLDLVEANRRQLISAGVRPEKISASPLCTACRPELLFSHRAEKGITGRMMGVIAIRK